MYLQTTLDTCLVLEQEVGGPVPAGVRRVLVPVLPARVELEHRKPLTPRDIAITAATTITATAGGTVGGVIPAVHDHNGGAETDGYADDGARCIRPVGLGARGVQDGGRGCVDLDGPVVAQALRLPGLREGDVDR